MALSTLYYVLIPLTESLENRSEDNTISQCVDNSSPLADCDLTIPNTPMAETTTPPVQETTTNSEVQTISPGSFNLTAWMTAIVPSILVIAAFLGTTFLLIILIACIRSRKFSTSTVSTSQACGVSPQAANATAIVLEENDAYRSRMIERNDVLSANVATKTNDAYGVSTANVATERNDAYGVSTANVVTERNDAYGVSTTLYGVAGGQDMPLYERIN